MRENFPLCAITVSKIYGPRFVAVVDCDDMTQDRLSEIIERFTMINLFNLQLGGRLTLKLLGNTALKLHGSSATGSMILITSKTRQAAVLREWVKQIPLHNDTALAQVKKMGKDPKFWAGLALGMVQYRPNQLRQEVIVLDAQSGLITSTESLRLPLEFGFSLPDITRPAQAAHPNRGITPAIEPANPPAPVIVPSAKPEEPPQTNLSPIPSTGEPRKKNFCYNCGIRLKEIYKFCPECGTDLRY